MFFLVFGVEMLFGLVPFTTCPLFALVFVVLSFFSLVVGMFVGEVFLLSLFLRCWEPQTPKLGFGFPVVFLRWTRTPSSTVLRAQHLHLGYAPAPVFFSLRVVVVSWFVGCRSRFVRSRFVWRCVVFCCMHM